MSSPLSIGRGTVMQLRENRKVVDAYYRGEENRHRLVGLSCVDCKGTECFIKCKGIRSVTGLSTYQINLRKGIPPLTRPEKRVDKI